MRTLEQLQATPVSEWTEKEKLDVELVRTVSKAGKDAQVVAFVLVDMMGKRSADYIKKQLLELGYCKDDFAAAFDLVKDTSQDAPEDIANYEKMVKQFIEEHLLEMEEKQ